MAAAAATRRSASSLRMTQSVLTFSSVATTSSMATSSRAASISSSVPPADTNSTGFIVWLGFTKSIGGTCPRTKTAKPSLLSLSTPRTLGDQKSLRPRRDRTCAACLSRARVLRRRQDQAAWSSRSKASTDSSRSLLRARSIAPFRSKSLPCQTRNSSAKSRNVISPATSSSARKRSPMADVVLGSKCTVSAGVLDHRSTSPQAAARGKQGSAVQLS